jgi:hypothetical protein
MQLAGWPTMAVVDDGGGFGRGSLVLAPDSGTGARQAPGGQRQARVGSLALGLAVARRAAVVRSQMRQINKIESFETCNIVELRHHLENARRQELEAAELLSIIRLKIAYLEKRKQYQLSLATISKQLKYFIKDIESFFVSELNDKSLLLERTTEKTASNRPTGARAFS